jgi:phosphoglycerol transferase MdoB-like AlkP superfamily enzyme
MKQKSKALVLLYICLVASLLVWLFTLTGVIGEKETWRIIFSSLGLAGILFLTIWLSKKLLKKA